MLCTTGRRTQSHWTVMRAFVGHTRLDDRDARPDSLASHARLARIALAEDWRAAVLR